LPEGSMPKPLGSANTFSSSCPFSCDTSERRISHPSSDIGSDQVAELSILLIDFRAQPTGGYPSIPTERRTVQRRTDQNNSAPFPHPCARHII
jgi:hypothetical protein